MVPNIAGSSENFHLVEVVQELKKETSVVFYVHF